MLGYTQELLDKVAVQTASSQRINKYQRLFKLEETKWVGRLCWGAGLPMGRAT